MLTLYVGVKDTESWSGAWAYKNQECTEEYQSFDEAKTAVDSASSIVLVSSDYETDGIETKYLGNSIYYKENGDVYVSFVSDDGFIRCYMWRKGGK